MGGCFEHIVWDKITFGSQIRPYQAYAERVGDIHLLSSFLELARLPNVGGSSVKLLLRAIQFLRHCDYSVEDICSVLGHASAYFVDALAIFSRDMQAKEAGNVLVTQMFIAHCYVQDETCPLHVWHKYLFKRYCPLKTLNEAVVRLLRIRQYNLRLDGEDSTRRFTFLHQAVLK